MKCLPRHCRTLVFTLVVIMLISSVTVNVLCSAGAGFLDINELDSTQYNIIIGGIPVLDTSLSKESSTGGVPMVNKFGQKYICQLPLSDDDLSTVDNVDGSTTSDETKTLTPADIPDLLAPMLLDTCIVKTKDWWTYEFCYQRALKQYHLEEGRPPGPIVILGQFDHDVEWPKTEAAAAAADKKNNNPDEKRYHSQIYTNGSLCDLTGELRRTEVRFECDPTTEIDYLESVEEPLSCEYLFVIRTNKICGVPEMQPPQPQKPKPIDCSPVLNEEEFQKFEKYKLAKEKYAAKKAEEAKQKKKEQMLKLLSGEDLSGIDVDSDEGLAMIEDRVGEKVAEKLVSQLGNFFDQKILGKGGIMGRTYTSLEDILMEAENEEDDRVIEEVRLSSGQKQSRLKKLKDPNWLNQMDQKERAMKEDKFTPPAKSLDKRATKTATKELISSNEDNDDDDGNIDDGVNLDPRSDLSDEDEMMDFLMETFRKLPANTNKHDMDVLKEEMKALRETLADSLEDILDETETEMNMQLAGLDRHNAINILGNTLQTLMEKLKETEADINRMNQEIERVQAAFDSHNSEDYIDADGNLVKGLKSSSKESKKKKQRRNKKRSSKAKKSGEEKRSTVVTEKQEKVEKEIENSDDADDELVQGKVKVKVTSVSTGKDATTSSDNKELRLMQHLESALKEKLEKSGLDTGGRQIEVKLITAPSIPVDDGLLDGQLEGEEDPDDALRVQHMIYNLMIGDSVGYQDIDTQRKSEKNYKFNYDEKVFEEFATTEAEVTELETEEITQHPPEVISATEETEKQP